MFSLMSGFIHYLFSRPEYFVLVIGLDNAGKTVRVSCHPPLSRRTPCPRVASSLHTLGESQGG
jgi:hypothetical protein